MEILNVYIINLLHVCNLVFALQCPKDTDILDLSNQNLTDIDKFENCEDIKTLILQRNNLNVLNEDIFGNFSKLESIDLSHNKLNNLSENIFRNLPKLRSINLDHNELENLDFLLKTSYIENLSTAFNKLSKLMKEGISIGNCNKLQFVNVSHNLLKDTNGEFNNCPNIVTLDFSYNELNTKYFGNDYYNQLNLKYLNYSNNRIDSIKFGEFFFLSYQAVSLDLRNNLIKEVEVNSVQIDENSLSVKTTIVWLDNNPIDCDNCKTYKLVEYFNNRFDQKYYQVAQIKGNENLRCAPETRLANQRVSDIKPETFLCNVDISCPISCNCLQRSNDESLIIDCSYRNFTKMPEINLHRADQFKNIELNLNGNFITEGPNINMGYEIITNLTLSHNKIRNISWIPSNLKIITLDNNEMEYIPFETLTTFNSSQLKLVTLHNNLWKCDCDLVNFTNFIRQNNLKILNPKHIYCEDGKTLLININESIACVNKKFLILILSVICVGMVLIAAIMSTIYYKYNYHIKVWLYSNGYCLNWLLIEDKDDKPFDAFISYSEEDENFIVQNLCKPLEQGPEKYKLCLQMRDATVGDLRHETIDQLIDKSRRTIVFLSNNFLKNVWNLHEFRTAHINAMNDPKKTVIVVIYKEVDIDNLDKELDTYLKTNTYVEWDDPWFWRKIKYALPHAIRT